MNKTILKTLSIFLLTVFISCSTKKALSQDIKSDGVLIVGKTNHYGLNDKSLKILNLDGSDYIDIYINEDGEILKSNTDSLKIRAFFPDYNIIIFDSKKTDNDYKVFVNEKWKKIKSGNNLSFVLWEDFIEQIYLGLTNQSPLYSEKNTKSKIIENYKNYYYEVLTRDEEWLKVRCWIDCEGCPQGEIIEGWIKWRKKQKLLVELYYIC
ncbi:hypothetical protein OAD49_04595 [Flavobacteriaceae bacterium]|nr:hypothetical protein [Flavobacteriaceae bacterium]